jgi:peptidoglycan/xylan/chitin deacetylase (PgdA/CDA1 family)
VILLKADDFTCCPAQDRFARFIGVIQRRSLRAGLGLIAKGLENTTQKDLLYLTQVVADGRFELWNHGYDHAILPATQRYEFCDSGYDLQRDRLRRAQDLVKSKLQLVMRAFGAPGNCFDADTLRVINQDPDIETWVYGDPSSVKYVIVRNAEAEFGCTGCVNAAEFISRYDAAKSYLTLQLHPKDWDDAQFAEFERILDFLAGKPVRFVLPSEMKSLSGPT